MKDPAQWQGLFRFAQQVDRESDIVSRDEQLPQRNIDEVCQYGHIVNVYCALPRFDLAYPRLSKARFVVDCALGKVGRLSGLAKVSSENKPLR